MGSTTIAMTSLLLVGFPTRQRRRITQVLLLIATLIGTAIGCAGKNAAAPLANPGTAPRTYTVTAAGSSGSIIASTTVTVTVN
jgi:hypothetical protein